MTVLGAMVTLSVGLTAGRIMAQRSSSPVVVGTRLLAWSAATFAVGAALTWLVEPYKRLWTPSFGLLAGSLVVAVVLVGWLLHDVTVRRDGPLLPQRSAALIIAHGRNPLLIYFGAHVVLHELSRWGGEDSLLDRLLRVPWPWGLSVATLAVLFAGAWAVVAWVLDRRGIYLRA